MNSLFRAAAIALAVLIIGSCYVAQGSLVLPGGSQVIIEGTGVIFFASGDRALQLRYLTTIPLTDNAALRSQAEEIWVVFRPQVEAGEWRWAALTAANKPKPRFGVSKRRVYHFGIFKNDDGSWTWLEDVEQR